MISTIYPFFKKWDDNSHLGKFDPMVTDHNTDHVTMLKPQSNNTKSEELANHTFFRDALQFY